VEKGENCCSVGKQTLQGCLKKVKNGTALSSSNCITSYLPKGYQNADLKEHKTPMFIAALSTITKLWKQSKCPMIDEWVKKCVYVYPSIIEYYSVTKKPKSCHLQRHG